MPRPAPTAAAATGATGTTSTEGTRERLLAAAARLFAARGVDAVSLREIGREAGARNTTALQYHFGDRAGLVRAVVAPHRHDVETARHALLDAAEADPPVELPTVAAALVRPLAARLADVDRGGPEHLQIVADLIERPRPTIPTATLEDPTDSMFRWRNVAAEVMSAEAVALHRRFAAYRFTVGELAQRARSGPHRDDRLFTSDLIDMVTSVLGADVSAATRRLRDARPPR